MSVRRVLEGFTPPVGYEWVTWAIEEASTPDDTLATIIEGPTAFIPAVDPEDPPTSTFATNNATLTTGWYRVVYQDGAGVAARTPWQLYRALSPYAPSVGDVASLMFARLVEDGGFRTNNFTDNTRPTAQEVQQIIGLHTPIVFARLGSLTDLGCGDADDLRAAATTLAAQRVKIEVESAYWPEEFGEQANPEQARAMLDADVEALAGRVMSCKAESADNGGDSTSRNDPAWRFPPPRRIRF